MITSFGILVAFLIGCIQCQSCDLNARCAQHLNNIPDCEPELKLNPLYKCLVELLQDCHNAPTLELEIKNIKLARDVFCKDKDLAARFKDNIQCWSLMKTCIANFGEARMQIEQNATTKQRICKEVKTTRDVCISHASDQCRDMETTFIDTARDVIICAPEKTTTERSNNAMNNVQNLTAASCVLLLFVYIM